MAFLEHPLLQHLGLEHLGLEHLGVYLRATDSRPRAEIEAEIHEEFAFHVEMRTRDNIAAGMDPDSAQRDAERRFGARTEVFAQCRRTQLGERIMLQRINFVLTVVLIGFVGLFGWNAWVAGQETSVAVGGLREEVAALTAALQEKRSVERVRRPAGPSTPDGVPVGRSASAAVVAASGPGGSESPPAEVAASPREVWLPRFRDAAPGFRGGYPLGRRIAALPADEGLRVMREIYHDIPSMEHRRQVLKPFVFHGGHPHATRVLHLAITDPHPGVQAWGFGYLESFTLRDFSDDYPAYEAWWAANSEADLESVLRTAATDWVGLLGRLEGDALDAEIARRERLDLRPGGPFGISFPALMMEAGLPALVEGWSGRLGDASLARAVRWLEELPIDAQYARRVLVPLLTPVGATGGKTRDAAAFVIGQAGEPWRAEVLHRAAADELGRGGASASGTRALLRGFVATEDAREIPALISLAIAYESAPQRAALDEVLEDRTGVDADRAHDGAWWRGWWERNRARLPAATQSISIEDGGMSR